MGFATPKTPGVCQQASPGCLGAEAPYDSPYRLLKGIANLRLQMTQLQWERDGGQDIISSRMAWLSNSVLLDCRRPLLLKHPQWSTPAITAAHLEMHKELWLWRDMHCSHIHRVRNCWRSGNLDHCLGSKLLYWLCEEMRQDSFLKYLALCLSLNRVDPWAA